MYFSTAVEIDQSSLQVTIEFDGDGGFARIILLGELTNTLDIAFVDILLADFEALEVVTVGKDSIQGFLLLLLDVDVGILVLLSRSAELLGKGGGTFIARDDATITNTLE
jgi:hypothetical protein